MCTQPTLEFLALEIHYSTNIYRCIYLNNMLFKKKKRICCSVSRTKPTPGDAKRREPKPVLRTEGRKTWLKLAGTTPVEVLWGVRGDLGEHSSEPEGQGKLIEERMSVSSLKEDWGYDRVGRKNNFRQTEQSDHIYFWQPTPVLLPGKSHGRRSVVGYSQWGHKDLDTTEWLHFHFSCTSK